MRGGWSPHRCPGIPGRTASTLRIRRALSICGSEMRSHTSRLLVHFTAPTLHAGFSGTLTLELINLGPLSISLYPGTPICQLIVETVKGVPFRNDSQFQRQSAPGGWA
jgi:deoxycytidine triphosphate deaminase